MAPLADDHGTPHVTVFLPTYNGGPLLEEVLYELEHQQTPFAFEILVIDSGSRDGTVERLRRHPVRLIEIPNSEFNHGGTRNRAVQEARGEIVILTVQDATPATRDWLATMVSNFEDPEVAGVYCHQIPRPDCSPFLRDRLSNWVRGVGEPIVHQVPDPARFYQDYDHIQRWQIIAFDNVASAVRRSVALRLPFVRRKFGEDVTWAKGAILAGYKILMDPRCAVIHSHPLRIWYEFKRAYLDHQNLNDLVGLRLASKWRHVLEYAAYNANHLFRVVWRDATLSWREKLKWSLRIPFFAFTQNLGQYLGPLSNHQGRRGLWRHWDRFMGRGV